MCDTTKKKFGMFDLSLYANSETDFLTTGGTEYLFLMQDSPVIGLTEYTMLFRREGVVYETRGID